MWGRILKKLRHLEQLDRQRVAFGAETHRYRLRPKLTLADLSQVERWLKTTLPTALRRFYLEVGNGVAGPHYGLWPAQKLGRGYRPDLPYPGVAALRKAASDAGQPPNERGYFEAPTESIVGLLPVIHKGCGMDDCLITTGRQRGRVVHVGDGYVYETGKTLVDCYDEWLTHEIALFDAVLGMMQARKTYHQIRREMESRFHNYSCEVLIATHANKRLPRELRGKAWGKQLPWYKQTLADWQKQHCAPRRRPSKTRPRA